MIQVVAAASAAVMFGIALVAFFLALVDLTIGAALAGLLALSVAILAQAADWPRRQ